mmetsp:Transcript_27755/g.49562  ORF Transcript_27755/g.49562 Transcript_27755/m.49562 type:complete len:251 (-) Transcript_27755:1905-2657(-)
MPHSKTSRPHSHRRLPCRLRHQCHHPHVLAKMRNPPSTWTTLRVHVFHQLRLFQVSVQIAAVEQHRLPYHERILSHPALTALRRPGIHPDHTLLVLRPLVCHALHQRLLHLHALVHNHHGLRQHLVTDTEAVVDAVGGKRLQNDLGRERLQVKRLWRPAVEDEHYIAHDRHGVVGLDRLHQAGCTERSRVCIQDHSQPAPGHRGGHHGRQRVDHLLATDEVDALVLQAAQLRRVARVEHRVKDTRESLHK